MCVGCGEMFDKRELIRVVKSPEGDISIDLTGKKNGRGAYICNNPECLKKAKKRKSLERAFSVKIDDEIYSKMEEEILNAKNKLLSLLGMAKRAGALSMGHDSAVNSVFSKKRQCLCLRRIFPKGQSVICA